MTEIEEKVTSNPMNLQDPNQPGWIQCFNPCTMGFLGRVKAMTPEEVEERVSRARRAQETWKTTSFQQRRRVLQIMLKFILEHQSDICLVAKTDSGKTSMLGYFVALEPHLTFVE